jgi:hypothetical protein
MSSTPRSLRRGRPELYSDYAADQAIWNTPAKRWSTGLVLILALSLPFTLSRDLMGLATLVVVYAISGIGLNLVSGYAGQISLGHAVFMGLGAYTAALLGGRPSSTVRGLELDLLIWLPMAGIVPALVGWLFAPLAARVRGLYLAILTLGLLFVGEHIFKEATLADRRLRGRSSPRSAQHPGLRPVCAADRVRHGAVRHRRLLPVHARCCSSSWPCSPATSRARARAGPSPRCVTATSLPRSWASRCCAPSGSRSRCRRSTPASAGRC